MNVRQAGTVLLLALWAFTASAAERALYTVVDGNARVLRKTTWYRLEAGTPVENGDVIDAGEHEQVQLELPHGGALCLTGPALAYLAELPGAGAKPGASTEVTLLRGWFKAASTPKSPPLALGLQAAGLRLADGIVVVHSDPARTEFFVEAGRVRLVTPAPRGKETVRDASEGEYWHRSGDRVFEADDRPSTAFVAAMPRALRDALPSLASRFDGPPPTLAAGREITFAEAGPWLAGATRPAFTRRLAPRLADREFRAAAAAAPRIPEWDRNLHPERYRQNDAADAAASRAAATPAPNR